MMEQKMQIKVLMIEDNPDDADLTKTMLSKSKDIIFNVENFERLKTALERIKDGGIDIILCDLNLPDSKGMDTFLKVYKQAKDVPIVLLTGSYEESELAIDALKKGAQDYLRKNEINSHLLVRAIRYAIERHEMQKKMDDLREELVTVLTHENTAGRPTACGGEESGLPAKLDKPRCRLI